MKTLAKRFKGMTEGEWSTRKSNGRIVEDANGEKVATASSSTIGPPAWINADAIASLPRILALCDRQAIALRDALDSLTELLDSDGADREQARRRVERAREVSAAHQQLAGGQDDE